MKCLNCDKEIKRRNEKFCNNKCCSEYKYKRYILKWKQGLETGLRGVSQLSLYVKRFIWEKYHNKCALCGWSEKNEHTNTIPLDIHHIDGNYLNNTEENLILLCPNCHSLTPNYKGANKKGRPNR